MVAVQVLLMNYFLLGLHPDTHYINDVLPRDDFAPCALGCSNCSPVNGCYSCKPPFLLILERQGLRQKGACRTECPQGFFGLYRGKAGFCTRCHLRGCLSCSSKSVCLQCRKGRVLYKGKCKKKCPRGSLYKPQANRCIFPKKVASVAGSVAKSGWQRSSNASTYKGEGSVSVAKGSARTPSSSQSKVTTITASAAEDASKEARARAERRHLRDKRRRKRRRKKKKKKWRKKKRKKRKKKKRRRNRGKWRSGRREAASPRHWKQRRKSLKKKKRLGSPFTNQTHTNR